jgi:hypothetical protein
MQRVGAFVLLAFAVLLTYATTAEWLGAVAIGLIGLALITIARGGRFPHNRERTVRHGMLTRSEISERQRAARYN